MNPSFAFRLSTLLLLVFGLPTVMHAAVAAEHDAWKTRCNLLAASASSIQNGTPPSVLSAATRGVASRPYYVLAVNRAENDQHFVACTLYYMAAIAARQGQRRQARPRYICRLRHPRRRGMEGRNRTEPHHVRAHEAPQAQGLRPHRRIAHLHAGRNLRRHRRGYNNAAHAHTCRHHRAPLNGPQNKRGASYTEAPQSF